MRIPTLAAALCAVLLAVPAAASADTATFTNNAGITIADNAPATPYPSEITVSGLTGRTAGVEVQLTGVTHSYMNDVDILLRSPSGETVMLISDSCAILGSPVDLRFADGAPAVTTCAAGTYRPTDPSPGDTMPAGGGTASATHLAAFAGEDPNGVWQLFAADDAGGDVGTMSGWSLTVTTGTGVVAVPASGTSGVASAHPIEVAGPDPGAGNVIRDLTVTLNGLFHANPEDLDILLQGPTGVSVPLVSDACGTADLSATLTFSDSAPSTLGSGPCATGTYRPTDPTPGDVWPAPAVAPNGTTLGAFDRTDPRGTWRIHVVDDAAGGTGAITGTATISGTATPARPLFFLSDSVLATEGTTATLRVVRLGSPSGPATVAYATAAGTATAGADFTAASGTLSFAEGELTKRIEVPVAADGTAEGSEHLLVRLSDVTGDAVLDGSGEARVTIAASEGPAAPTTPTTPAPRTPAAPCAALKGTAKATCMRKRTAAAARTACLKRHPTAGARRTACLRAAAKLALPPGRR